MKTDKVKQNREETNQSSGSFPQKMGAPAMRALANAGYTHLEQLALVREDEVKKLHGIGPHALKLLTQALHNKGLSFKNSR
jgi:hypothetical protein